MKYLLLLLLLSSTASTLLAANRVEVCPTCDARTIQQGVNAVDEGGTVVLHAGLYAEHDIVISRPMQIWGAPDYASVVDAEKRGHVFIVNAAHVTLRGLTLRNPGVAAIRDVAAIRIENTHHCLVDDNRITEATYGIYLAKVADCTVIRNEVITHRVGGVDSGSGIHIWQSNTIQVVGNKVSGHRDGIYLEFTSASSVVANESTHNLRYGLHFMFSHQNVFERNQFIGNESGVAVMYSRDIVMQANRFEQSFGAASYGLLLKDISGSRIIGNLVKANTTGMFVEGVTRTLIQENDLIDNGWAVRLFSSSENNTFMGNNFINNTFELSAMPGWTRNVFAGNYWSLYRGIDMNRDGIGDSPYRPVRLSAVWVQSVDGASLLLHSFFLALVDQAEAVIPSITPVDIVDERPLIGRRP